MDDDLLLTLRRLDGGPAFELHFASSQHLSIESTWANPRHGQAVCATVVIMLMESPRVHEASSPRELLSEVARALRFMVDHEMIVARGGAWHVLSREMLDLVADTRPAIGEA